VSRRLALAGALSALVFLAPSYAAPARAAGHTLPRLVLWAWERPEDLRALDPDTGVAFLAQTITLTADRAATLKASPHTVHALKGSPDTVHALKGPSYTVQPRRQPLRVGRDTALVAVTRIEVARSTAVASSAIDADAIATVIARTATLPQVVAVQVDFDAVASERPFYRRLLERLRARLDPAMPISITALASWCVGDDWLGDLSIDEAVPMLFRMGAVNQPFQRAASSRRGVARACRGALGLSTDEPLGVVADGRRVYIFNPKPWTARTIIDARREAFRR
jgi:hypothetical protein